MPAVTFSRSKFDSWTTGLFWLGIALVWATTLFMPLYPDEIAYRLINSRAYLEHGRLANIFPTCTVSFNLSAPYTWLPIKIFDYLAFGWYDSPFLYRVVSVIILIASYIGLVRLLKIMGYGKQGLRLFVLTCSLGVIPFSYVMVRPEGMLFASVIWLMVISLDREPLKAKSIASAALFYLLASLAISSHPKAYFFLPAFFALCFFWSKRSGNAPVARTALWVGLLALAFESGRYWLAFSTCTENTGIKDMLAGLTLSPRIFIENPSTFIEVFIGNIVQSYQYWADAIFQRQYYAGWLPDTDNNTHYILGWFPNILLIAVSVVSLFVVLVQIASYFRIFVQPKTVIAEVLETPASVVGALITLTILFYAGINSGKHFYEVAFIFPFLLLAAFAVRGRFYNSLSYMESRITAAAVMAVVCLLTAFLFIADFAVPFFKGFNGKGVALMSYSDKKIADQMAKIHDRCRIPDDKTTISNLVVDDLTYQYYRESAKPMIINWLYMSTTSMDRKAYIRDLKIAGVVARCGFIPDEMHKTKQFYSPVPNPDPLLDICCVAPGLYESE